MKLKSIIQLIAASTAFMIILVLSSCSEDLFNEPAGERITPDIYYNSGDDVSVSMWGTVIPLQDIIPQLILVDGLRSDQMDITSNADAHLRAIYMHEISSDNPYINPASLYQAIINTNELLANIDSVMARDSKFDSLYHATFKGALIGFRAWNYLNIVRLFGEAALIPDNMTSLPEGGLEYFSKETLINKLIPELEPYIYDQESGLVELPIIDYTNNRAVLGEMYLELGDYTNAVKYLKQSLESYFTVPSVLDALYKVDNTYALESWKENFVSAQDNLFENIAVVPFNSFQGQVNPIVTKMMPSGQFMVQPSRVLVDSFDVQLGPGDALGDKYRGLGVTYDTLNSKDETYIKKYLLDEGEPFSTDIILSRASDIHLLLAEALNRTGDPEDQRTALILINEGIKGEKASQRPDGYARFSKNVGIRGRVSLQPRILPDTTGMENADEFVTEFIEDLIIEEKAMECAFEGKRMTDLIRIAERRDDPSYLANKIAAKYEGTGNEEMIRTKLLNKANWYLPFEK